MYSVAGSKRVSRTVPRRHGFPFPKHGSHGTGWRRYRSDRRIQRKLKVSYGHSAPAIRPASFSVAMNPAANPSRSIVVAMGISKQCRKIASFVDDVDNVVEHRSALRVLLQLVLSLLPLGDVPVQLETP